MLRCSGGLEKIFMAYGWVIPLWPGSDHQDGMMRLLAANFSGCCRCCLYLGWLGWRGAPR